MYRFLEKTLNLNPKPLNLDPKENLKPYP
jgi:hypothetical protein